jgi:hypothetical protein
MVREESRGAGNLLLHLIAFAASHCFRCIYFSILAIWLHLIAFAVYISQKLAPARKTLLEGI